MVPGSCWPAATQGQAACIVLLTIHDLRRLRSEVRLAVRAQVHVEVGLLSCGSTAVGAIRPVQVHSRPARTAACIVGTARGPIARRQPARGPTHAPYAPFTKSLTMRSLLLSGWYFPKRTA